MCLNPITVPNPTKYISLRHRDKFMMEIPCGRCSECQKVIRNQWYYRAYYEWSSLPRDGYVLFDTLTYRNQRLPHLSDTWTMLSKSEDFSCFNYIHIRQFIENLRIRLKRYGYGDCFKFFVAAEYGSINKTFRPHYHLMLYVHNPNISPLWLSRLISMLWKYGRTDGVPYKSHYYVTGHNVIYANSGEGSKLRTCSYVTKYVQKDCAYQDILNARIDKVMWRLAEFVTKDSVEDTPVDWLVTEEAHRERLKLMRFVNQFHRQSQHFGEIALRDLDLTQLFRDGCLWMPDSKNVSIPIPLPTYYKRKLFQEQVEFNGSRYWQLNDLGKDYVKYRRDIARVKLADTYRAVAAENHLYVDCNALADYVLFERGRIRGVLDESTLEERVNDIDLYNYSTGSDKLNFRQRGLTPYWHGDSQQGYNGNRLLERKSIQEFVNRYCIIDKDKEAILLKIAGLARERADGQQRAFRLRQRLEQMDKQLSRKLNL